MIKLSDKIFICTDEDLGLTDRKLCMPLFIVNTEAAELFRLSANMHVAKL